MLTRPEAHLRTEHLCQHSAIGGGEAERLFNSESVPDRLHATAGPPAVTSLPGSYCWLLKLL